MIQVLNKHKDDIPKGSFYIGRGSPLGNPYDHGNSCHPDVKFKTKSREESVTMFIHYLSEQIRNCNPEICHEINKLIIKDKLKQDVDLVCFCAPLLCHGSVIKKYIENSKYCINWFSNMSQMEEPLVYQGIVYWTVENFYQAMKVEKNNLELRRVFAHINPYEAKIRAKSLIYNQKEWSEKKINVMKYVLKHKFAKGTTWRDKLDNFNHEIVEWNNWKDKFWGKCIFDNEGENRLGRILTEIKNEI